MAWHQQSKISKAGICAGMAISAIMWRKRPRRSIGGGAGVGNGMAALEKRVSGSGMAWQRNGASGNNNGVMA